MRKIIILFLFFMFALGSAKQDQEAKSSANPQSQVKDVQANIVEVDNFPPVNIPKYNGEKYSIRIPDTLDLAECAELVINAISGCLSPGKDYSVCLRINLEDDETISMWQESSMSGKLLDALVLMRIMTGSELNIDMDKKWRERFLQGFEKEVPFLTSPEGGRTFSWIASNYIYEKDARWKELGEKAIKRLLKEVKDEGNYCYLINMPGVYGAADLEKRMPKGWEATFHGWILQGISQFYVATGSAIARDLAQKMARYLKDHAEIFDKDGKFIAVHYFTGQPALHFVHNINVLEALLEFALATKDMEFAQFIKKSYEWARSQGSPLTGFFPEYLKLWPDARTFENTETCAIAYMIQIAIGLSELGVGDYWDDVDRYLRNQFSENQLPAWKELGVEYWWHRVSGAFASWALPNEFNAPANIWTTFTLCCTANGARTLHRIWDKMINYNDGKLQLNLLLNRSSQWVDINSYIPYEGRLDISVKQPLKEISVRMPEWIKSGSKEVLCQINGEVSQFKWNGRYIYLNNLNANDAIVLTFPISERTVKEVIGKVDGKPVEYAFIIRGNNVVSISPPSKNEPYFYEKGSLYRSGKIPWKKAQRFILESN